MTNEELINQRKKEIAELTSQIDKSKINYDLPMGSWVSYKESEISYRERMSIEEAIKHLGNYSSTNGSGLTTDKQHNEAKRVAIETMRKYQKIEQIYKNYKSGGFMSISMQQIGEVLEDGKIDAAEFTRKGDQWEN